MADFDILVCLFLCLDKIVKSKSLSDLGPKKGMSMLCGVLLVKFQACQLALWKARQYFSNISTNEQLTRCICVSAKLENAYMRLTS